MSTSIGHPPRLRYKVKHLLSSTMLCCGRKKECVDVCSNEGVRGGRLEMVVQSDFRKVSGISTEIFRQIEAVEKDFDPRAAAAVERRGEMVIRLLEPASLGRVGADACRRYLRAQTAQHAVQFVEIVKRPGQTLGLYIREGDPATHSDGVFISRIALESAVYTSGLLKVEDEILAVNLVDVRHVSLDDVVIIMSIPRRLVLTIRSRLSGGRTGRAAVPEEMARAPPVLVLKKEFVDEPQDDYPQDWTTLRTQVMLEPPRPDVAPYYYGGQPEGSIRWEERVLTRQPQTTFPRADQVPFEVQLYPPQRLRSLGPRRTESEQRLSTLGADDRYYSLGRPIRRSGSSITMQQRPRPPRREEPLAGRRRTLDGSASDTEALESALAARRAGGAGRLLATATAATRSHSLPRVRMSEMDFRRFQRMADPPPAPRRRDRARRMTSPIFTSTEYSQWLSRAPSASALYTRPPVRMPRSAHSAESLLDRLKQEEGGRLLRSASSSGVPPQPPSAGEQRLLALNPRDFLKHRPEKECEGVLGGGGFSGLLWVHLLAGRGLRGGPEGGGTRDLYCVVECDRVHKARTVARPGEHAFDWDEVFELELAECAQVAFLLYSWDPQLRHKLCYKGSLHLLTILREAPQHSLALKMEPRGTLYLKLRYRDPRQTFQRLPSPGGVFGCDLESLVIREKSGFSVPVLVKRCCEEVERRGLDIVGIYRLCGSAARKKTLRDAFERNAFSVDLSSDHVPDINVITSVLKDYLRELPEPLFTKGLFDMLVDGFSVCLPDDPEGNAKLMFSILDCLPKVNRCTVLYLLDHLQLVCSRAASNKMSSGGLAACFGPVLMCHTESGAPAADTGKPVDIVKYLIDIWPGGGWRGAE